MLSCPTCDSIDKVVSVRSILNQSTSPQYSTTYGAIVDLADAQFTPVVGVTKREVSQQFLNLQGRLQRWIKEPLVGDNPGATAMRLLCTVLAFIFFFAGGLGIFFVVAAWNSNSLGHFDSVGFAYSCLLGFGPVAFFVWLRGRFQMKVAASVTENEYEISQARSDGWFCYRCDAPYSTEVKVAKKKKTQNTNLAGSAMLAVKNESRALALGIAILAGLGTIPGLMTLIPKPAPTVPTSSLTSNSFQYVAPTSGDALAKSWKGFLKTCGYPMRVAGQDGFYSTNYNLDSGDTFPGGWLFNVYSDSVSLSIDVKTAPNDLDCLSQKILGIDASKVGITEEPEIFPAGFSLDRSSVFFTFQWDQPVTE